MLSRQEKRAIFELSILAIAVVVFLSLMPSYGIRTAVAAFGVLGFWGLGPILFSRKKTPSEVIEDEHDILIKRKATQIAFAIFWVYFVVSSMTIWFSHFKAGVVSVDAFPLLVLGGWTLFTLTFSLSTIYQYRQGTASDTC